MVKYFGFKQLYWPHDIFTSHLVKETIKLDRNSDLIYKAILTKKICLYYPDPPAIQQGHCLALGSVREGDEAWWRGAVIVIKGEKGE